MGGGGKTRKLGPRTSPSLTPEIKAERGVLREMGTSSSCLQEIVASLADSDDEISEAA
jgi:hypothetical protein